MEQICARDPNLRTWAAKVEHVELEPLGHRAGPTLFKVLSKCNKLSSYTFKTVFVQAVLAYGLLCYMRISFASIFITLLVLTLSQFVSHFVL